MVKSGKVKGSKMSIWEMWSRQKRRLTKKETSSLFKITNFCKNWQTQLSMFRYFYLFAIAAMPFLCTSILLFQGNLPWVLSVTIFKHARCLILYIVLFLIMCGEWPSLVFKDLQKYFFMSTQNSAIIPKICLPPYTVLINCDPTKPRISGETFHFGRK